jgi:hypothetical protein
MCPVAHLQFQVVRKNIILPRPARKGPDFHEYHFMIFIMMSFHCYVLESGLTCAQELTYTSITITQGTFPSGGLRHVAFDCAIVCYPRRLPCWLP